MILSSAAGKWLLRVPLIHGGPFTGTGDMTAAMTPGMRCGVLLLSCFLCHISLPYLLGSVGDWQV